MLHSSIIPCNIVSIAYNDHTYTDPKTWDMTTDGSPASAEQCCITLDPWKSAAIFAKDLKTCVADRDAKAEVSVSSTSSLCLSDLVHRRSHEYLHDLPSDSPITLKPKNRTFLKFLLRRCGHPVDQAQEDAKIPLVLFLHGASARAETFASHAQAALPGQIEAIEKSRALDKLDSGFLLFSPLCPKGIEWKHPSMLQALVYTLEAVCEKCRVDRDRVYLTGVSMGGLGSWVLGAKHADMFAAVAPICGGGSPVYARLLKDMPMCV